MTGVDHILRQVLTAVVKLDDARHAATEFYNNWFQRGGKSYFFVFKKNLSVTNLQYAEFMALLRRHITEGSPIIRTAEPTFANADEIKEVLANLLADFFMGSRKPCSEQALLDTIEAVCENYGDTLRNTVVLNPYFGSTTIYLPPATDVDVRAMCAESGYIHSCGQLIYVRNMIKASIDELRALLDQHLVRHHSDLGYPVFFRTYSHEDFDQWDRRSPAGTSKAHYFDLSYGLDEIKISTRKAYFGKKSIINAIRELKQAFSGRVVFAEPGNYESALRNYVETYKPSKMATIFLVNDREVNSNQRFPAQKRYYVCYEQLYYNDDPLYVFDEDKPGWVAHTTIPHSLASAMINITRVRKEGEKSLLDPFGGSGTIFLEAIKRPEITNAITRDLSKAAARACLDNIEFFVMGIDGLNRIVSDLSELLDSNKTLNYSAGLSNIRPGNINLEMVTSLRERVMVRTDDGAELRDDEAARSGLDALSLAERLVFYVLLRTEIRHLAERVEGRDEWSGAFGTELSNVVLRMRAYIEFRRRSDVALSTRHEYVLAYEGEYSRSCTIDIRDRLDALHKKNVDLFQWGLSNFVQIGDALDIPRGKFDLIVTDPPYGFNTDADDIQLSRLYSKFLGTALDRLRTGGHLVLCCPEYSHSGRRIPMYARPQIVTRQILTLAYKLKREIRVPSRSIPRELGSLYPPYYWEAPSALRRSILHFQVI